MDSGLWWRPERDRLWAVEARRRRRSPDEPRAEEDCGGGLEESRERISSPVGRLRRHSPATGSLGHRTECLGGLWTRSDSSYSVLGRLEPPMRMKERRERERPITTVNRDGVRRRERSVFCVGDKERVEGESARGISRKREWEMSFYTRLFAK